MIQPYFRRRLTRKLVNGYQYVTPNIPKALLDAVGLELGARVIMFAEPEATPPRIVIQKESA